MALIPREQNWLCSMGCYQNTVTVANCGLSASFCMQKRVNGAGEEPWVKKNPTNLQYIGLFRNGVCTTGHIVLDDG